MRKGWIVCLGFLLLAGCRGQTSMDPPREIFQDMSDQPKYKAQGQSRFFADGRAMRPLVPGTIPFGGANYAADAGVLTANPDFLREDAAFYRGVVAREPGAQPPEEFIRRIPVPLTKELLERGRERYGIFCAVCHGDAGYGDGITTKYGMVGVANLHLPKYREMPDGEIYHVIANGRNTMLPYAAQIKPSDRWAIVAWVRVLQRSQHATLDDVPPEHRGELEKQP
ncbi:MAG: cytochrome c [Gemmataceae bacterium]|nr:cytochrome c [Gemmataceae bacterium]